MKRIRTLCLAAVAVLALLATFVVAIASASSGFLADGYPATQTGKGTGGNQTLTFNDASYSCAAPEFEAEASGPSESTTSKSLSSPSCTINGSGTSLKTNGCQLTFHPGAEQSAGVFDGSFEIGPAGCGPITIQPPFGCKVSVGAQSGLAATYQNQGSGSGATVKINAAANNVKFSQSGVGCTNPGSFSNGSWNGSWQVSGKRFNQATGLHVGDLRVSLATSGGQFVAGEYPAAVLGSQDASDPLVLSTNSGTEQCAGTQFSSGLTSAWSSLSLTASPTECSGFGYVGGMTVKTNSCQYIVDASGTFGITCAGSDKMEIRVPGCLTTIGSQSGLSGLTLSNVGTGSEAGVAADVAVGGISYVEAPKGFFSTCYEPGGGSYSNGSLSGGLTLGGFNGGFIG